MYIRIYLSIYLYLSMVSGLALFSVSVMPQDLPQDPLRPSKHCQMPPNKASFEASKRP